MRPAVPVGCGTGVGNGLRHALALPGRRRRQAEEALVGPVELRDVRQGNNLAGLVDRHGLVIDHAEENPIVVVGSHDHVAGLELIDRHVLADVLSRGGILNQPLRLPGRCSCGLARRYTP